MRFFFLLTLVVSALAANGYPAATNHMKVAKAIKTPKHCAVKHWNVIEAQVDDFGIWIDLPTNAHKLARLIIPDEEHGLEETIFRVGVILTIPWVNNENSRTCDELENAETSYDATTVPECLDIGYNGPISQSTLQLLRSTIEIQARLGSPDTLLALVDYLRNVGTSPHELASALVRAVAGYVAGNIRKDQQFSLYWTF
jgi:hypothetical protein